MDNYSNLIIIPFFLLAILACGATARVSYGLRQISQDPRDARVWLLLAAIFLLFVLVKAGSVLELLSNVARQEAKDQGWYARRRPVQLAVVIGAGVLELAHVVYFSRYIVQRWRRFRWPLIGTGTILCFSLVRAASLHELDALKDGMTAAKVMVESLSALLAAWGAWAWVKTLRQAVATVGH